MQRQSFITLVAAFGLLTGAPLAQAKNHLKKPLIERIDGALAKAKRTRESRALIREQQRKEKEAANPLPRPLRRSVNKRIKTKQPEWIFRLLYYVLHGNSLRLLGYSKQPKKGVNSFTSRNTRLAAWSLV